MARIRTKGSTRDRGSFRRTIRAGDGDGHQRGDRAADDCGDHAAVGATGEAGNSEAGARARAAAHDGQTCVAAARRHAVGAEAAEEPAFTGTAWFNALRPDKFAPATRPRGRLARRWVAGHLIASA